MIIHCPYCHKEVFDKSQSLDNPDRYRAHCYHGDVKITIIYHLGMSKDPMFIWLEVSQYLLVLSLIDKDCYLYTQWDTVPRSLEYMMHLNHLPNITPENVKAWIVRLLNIKAFS